MRSSSKNILLRSVFTLLLCLALARRTAASAADASPASSPNAAAHSSSSSSPPAASSSSSSTTKTNPHPPPIPAKVVELDARNFDRNIRDGNAWLVEFYAPWCGHCKRFAPTYEEVAKRLHNLPPGEGRPDGKRVMVAKVDGSADRALAARFSIHAFPTFYLIDGWDVYQYEGRRTLDDLVDFATEDYMDVEPIPFLNSPFGPMGQIRAAMMYVGTSVLGTYEYLVEQRGYSKGTAACVVIAGGIGLGLVTIVGVGLVMVPKPKED